MESSGSAFKNMEKPTVSILLATRNRANLIGKAIESVCAQTFQDWELLVLDDGSPDNTTEVVAAWEKKDLRIKHLTFSRIGNIAGVSNAGLRAARGEFVAILDDDDWWVDDRKLEKQIRFLQAHSDYVACGGWATIVNGHGEVIGKIKKPETDEAIRHVMLAANGIINSTGIFRRAEAGFYDETIKQFADWDFYLRLGRHGKFYNFPEYFLAYRMWDEGSSFVNNRANADAAVAIVERYRNDYPGYIQAFIVSRGYQLYARLPAVIRRSANAFMSRLKKYLFSR